MEPDFKPTFFCRNLQYTDEDANPDSIAIRGMSCRLPMAPSPEAFWGLLRDGGNAVTQVSADRPNLASSFDPSMFRSDEFLDQIDRFNAGFFGLSPREATRIDPLQRLMLELSWEALEDARTVPGELKGSQAGVFVCATQDDSAALLPQQDIEAVPSFPIANLAACCRGEGVIARVWDWRDGAWAFGKRASALYLGKIVLKFEGLHE